MGHRTVRLRTAIGSYPHTRAIRDGELVPDGVDLDLVEVNPIIGAFRRMVRTLEFDVSEMAPTTYVMARSLGVPIVALPIFLSRRFHHHGLVRRDGSGITGPKDLEHRRVGLRAYSVTTGVWTRGLLAHEYDVDPAKITWVVDDEEHVQEFVLPPNVEHAPSGRSLRDLIAAGEVDAAFTGNAGIGRAGPPESGWVADSPTPTYSEMFDDSLQLEADWYERTGIYPIHGLVVIKESVLAEHPWVADSLYACFDRAREEYVSSLATAPGDTADDRRYLETREIVGDPLPYGVAPNVRTLEALLDYTHEQGLITERPTLSAMFPAIATEHSDRADQEVAR